MYIDMYRIDDTQLVFKLSLSLSLYYTIHSLSYRVPYLHQNQESQKRTFSTFRIVIPKVKNPSCRNKYLPYRFLLTSSQHKPLLSLSPVENERPRV